LNVELFNLLRVVIRFVDALIIYIGFEKLVINMKHARCITPYIHHHTIHICIVY